MSKTYFDSPEWEKADIGGTGCLGAGSGFINDDCAAACWSVHAAPVIINDTWMSVDAGFQFINMLYRSFGNQPSVSCKLDLEGPIVT